MTAPACEVSLARDETAILLPKCDKSVNLLMPGDIITSEMGFMRGHGTFLEDDKLKACVSGTMEQTNKLLTVRAVRGRYVGEVGDVVVGRVREVQQRRWKVDINSRLHANLLLNSVNLPGGQLRRKTQEDELAMRNYLQEGDLISAEVQSVFQDGSLSLHTRSLKYGKLGLGQLVKVPPLLVKRRKTHFHNLPFGVSLILGTNGYIWVCATINVPSQHTGGYVQDFNPLSKEDRENIARVSNCINAMTEHHIMLYDTSILYAYEASLCYLVSDLLKEDVKQEVMQIARQRLDEEL